MKKTSLFLFAVLAMTYLIEGYHTHIASPPPSVSKQTKLSDMAEEVVAITLQPANGKSIKTARSVQKVGADLFLVGCNTLYRYSNKGEFIAQITHPDTIQVAGYMVNSMKKQLIVLGNTDDIHYYSFDGTLLHKKKFQAKQNKQHLYSATLHKQKVWTTEAHVSKDLPTTSAQVLKQTLCTYDTSFRQQTTTPLTSVQTGRENLTPSPIRPTIFVGESGIPYVYTPSVQPEQLLRDTLHILGKQGEKAAPIAENAEALPVHISSRMCLSSTPSYTFCYDRLLNKSWLSYEGIADDFCQTGTIAQLQKTNNSSNQYFFHKEETLFLVKIKA